MIPIGNGIQLVWITTLGYDWSPTLLFHTVHEWKAFTGREETVKYITLEGEKSKTEYCLDLCYIYKSQIYFWERIYKLSVFFTRLFIQGFVIHR